MAVVAWLMHSNDVSNYPYDVHHSPTKIVHDLIGYFFFLAVFLWLGLPQVVRLFSHRVISRGTVVDWVVIAICIAVYIGCTIYDQTHSRTVEDLLACHPAEWKPIWRK